MRISLSLIAILLTSLTAFGADYYAGSPKEAELLFNKAAAGDRIFLKDGVYRDAEIQLFNPRGTKELPIRFAAQTPGKVYFEGNSTLRFAGTHLIVSGFVWQNGGAGLGSNSVVEFRNGKNTASHCILENCVIDSYNTDTKENTENKWVSLFGQYNTVTACLFRNKINRGPTVTVWLESGKPAAHIISFNYFKIRGNAHDDSNGLESIRVGDSKTSFTEAHCVVAFNRFEECDGEIEIISNKSCRNSYLYNTFYRNDGGLTLRHGNNCLVSGNAFYGGDKPLAYGVRIIGEGHTVINNLFYALRGGENKGFRSALSILNGMENSPLNGYFQVRNASVAGNIFVNCAPPYVYAAFHSRPEAYLVPENIRLEKNLFYCDSGRRGPAYAELKAIKNLLSRDNYVVGLLLPEGTRGFASAKAKGITRDGYQLSGLSEEITEKVYPRAAANENCGSAYISPSLASLLSDAKFCFLNAADVGPLWLR